jgi:hypothetical protein
MAIRRMLVQTATAPHLSLTVSALHVRYTSYIRTFLKQRKDITTINFYIRELKLGLIDLDIAAAKCSKQVKDFL